MKNTSSLRVLIISDRLMYNAQKLADCLTSTGGSGCCSDNIR